MYIPTTGRFLQEDPAGYIDGANRYAAERSNPATLTDPSGLTAEDDSKEVVKRYRALHAGDPGAPTAWGDPLQSAIELNNLTPGEQAAAAEQKRLAAIPKNIAKDKLDAKKGNHVNCRKWAFNTNGAQGTGAYPSGPDGKPLPLESPDDLGSFTQKEVEEAGGTSTTKNAPVTPGFHKIAAYWRQNSLTGDVDVHYATQDDDGRWSNKEAEENPATFVRDPDNNNNSLSQTTTVVGYWEVPGPPRTSASIP